MDQLGQLATLVHVVPSVLAGAAGAPRILEKGPSRLTSMLADRRICFHNCTPVAAQERVLYTRARHSKFSDPRSNVWSQGSFLHLSGERFRVSYVVV